MASDQAIQRAAVAVAVFDAGWPVPDLQLVDGPAPDPKASLGKALVDLEAMPAGERPVEAAVGLRLLLVHELAPALLRGSPRDLNSDVSAHALYIASHVPGASPPERLAAAAAAVCHWLESPVIQDAIRALADDLERERELTGAVAAQHLELRRRRPDLL